MGWLISRSDVLYQLQSEDAGFFFKLCDGLCGSGSAVCVDAANGKNSETIERKHQEWSRRDIIIS